MQLNDDWENNIQKTNYFSYDYTNENGETKKASGITMLSMLFLQSWGTDNAKNFGADLFPRATSRAAMLAWIFGDCREGQIPRSSAALQV